MNRRVSILLTLLAVLPLAAETTVIRNATVLTVTKGTFQGSVLIRDGKIVEAGEKVLVPGWRAGYRCGRPVRDARHHRLSLAHRRR